MTTGIHGWGALGGTSEWQAMTPAAFLFLVRQCLMAPRRGRETSPPLGAGTVVFPTLGGCQMWVGGSERTSPA